ncbi:MAG: T9SS type A sorting domain-containing protein [Bacteroidia bacterium]
MKIKLLLLTFMSLVIFLSSTQAQTSSIAFCSQELGGGADDSFVTLLQNAGYNVHAVDDYWNNIDSADVVALDTFDLVIISKATTSGNFGDTPAEVANWMSITTPVIIMNDFVARSNRLKLFNTTTTTANGGLKLDVVLPTHPLFTNMTLVGDSTNEISIDPLETIVATDAGNGTVIATDALTGNVAIAEWAPLTEFYAGAVDSANGARMYFATDYGYKLTPDGDQLFLDAVQYMITGSVQGPPQSPERLIWVTENLAADALYISEIEAQGFEVIPADLQASIVNADPTGIMDSLAAADLVIFSRNTNSANYSNKAFWNNVPTPILTLSAFVARNNRWGFSSDPSTNISADGKDIKIVADTSSALFEYITITDSILTVLTSGALEFAVFTDTIGAGNGVLYARSTSLNRVAIAEWPANTPFYEGSQDSAADIRLLLPLTGSNVLTLDGKQLLMNAINLLLGLPASPVLLTQNYAPYDLALSNDTIAENKAAGTFIATIEVSDLNEADFHTYVLGGVDSASFLISQDSLFAAISFDFETKSAFNFSITATDSAGESYTKDFTVTITNDTTDDVTSIEAFIFSDIRVFPNPFTNVIEIEGVQVNHFSVELADLTGRVIYQTTQNKSTPTLQINLPALPGGIYLLKLSSESGTRTLKLIRE